MTTKCEYIMAEIESYCGKVLTTFGVANEYSVSKERREDIVRCCGCKHFNSDICERVPYGIKAEPNGFCAWGQRKDSTK